MRSDTLLSDYNTHPNDIVHVHLLHTSSSLPLSSSSSGVVLTSPMVPPPPLLLFVLALMCSFLGAAWGTFLCAGYAVFDPASTCLLLSFSGLTGVGILYAHVMQRPMAIPA